QMTSRVPASRSPFARTVAKPPAVSTARIRPVTSTWAGSRDSGRSAIGSIAGKAGEYDVRAQESTCTASDFVAFRVNQARLGDEDPPPAADPATLGDDLASEIGRASCRERAS